MYMSVMTPRKLKVDAPHPPVNRIFVPMESTLPPHFDEDALGPIVTLGFEPHPELLNSISEGGLHRACNQSGQLFGVAVTRPTGLGDAVIEVCDGFFNVGILMLGFNEIENIQQFLCRVHPVNTVIGKVIAPPEISEQEKVDHRGNVGVVDVEVWNLFNRH